ncbi:hypothetical protein DIE22_18365 [Burkholderia sp. Bp9142]|nr:hypothetical protein DIE22_18365 [Burkholderia sp. Bp9142]
MGLSWSQKRQFKTMTNSKHDLSVAPNLLSRDFSLTAPNQAWHRDISYIATNEGWLYLAVLKERYGREIVGYALSERMTKIWSYRPCSTRRHQAAACRSDHHINRGSQYCALAY